MSLVDTNDPWLIGGVLVTSHKAAHVELHTRPAAITQDCQTSRAESMHNEARSLSQPLVRERLQFVPSTQVYAAHSREIVMVFTARIKR